VPCPLLAEVDTRPAIVARRGCLRLPSGHSELPAPKRSSPPADTRQRSAGALRVPGGEGR
jgi:hypothetical protein